MSDPERSPTTVVEFIEEWQTGFFILLGSVVVGFSTLAIGGNVIKRPFLLLFAGTILGFLGFSYLLYGT